MDAGTYIEPNKLTVAEYLGRWLEDYGRPNLATSTLVSYTRIIRRHIIPVLGHIQLSKLQPLHIQNYYSRALANGRLDGKGVLSLRTVQYHHRVLREALNHAVKWQIVARNVADAVEAPRPQRPDVKALDPAQAQKLLAAAKGHPDEFLIALDLHTGLRQGELLGLRWEDVDLESGHLYIRQALQRLPRQGFSYRVPKNKKGRPVAIGPRAMKIISKVKELQKKQKWAKKDEYQDNGLVFCNPDGAPLDPSTVSHRFRDLADSLGFFGVRFHDLRHTHATMLLIQGVHPKIVQERLGHKSIGITLDTYSHVLPGLQEAAASKFEELLETDGGQRNGNDDKKQPPDGRRSNSLKALV